MATTAVVRRLISGVVDDEVVDLAAMQTYYAIFAIFPMTLFVLSLSLMVLPGGVIAEAVQMAVRVLPPEVGRLFATEVSRTRDATQPHIAIIGGALTLWGASRGTAALIVALNRVFEVHETRSWLRRQLLAIGVTVAVAFMIVVALGLLLLGPALGTWLTEHSRLGRAFAVLWVLIRWVGAAAIMTGVWALLYRVLPDRRVPMKVITPGAALGVVLWIAVTRGAALFLTYVTDYHSYGALAGALTVLFWLWLSNLALLVGAELSRVLRA